LVGSSDDHLVKLEEKMEEAVVVMKTMEVAMVEIVA